jgi:hypothetical protein
MISGSYTLLPYMLIKSGTSWTKYRFEQHNQSLGTFKSLNVADNITLGGTVDGHDIDSELDTLNSDVSTLNSRVNQDLKTTASPTFASLGITGAISGASINTGHGDNEVFKITNETLSFGYNNTSNVSVQVSAMEVGEIRFVNTIGTLAPGAVSTYYGNLKTPATVGTYFVIPVGQGELHPYTGVQAYNVSLWSIYNGSEYTINLESSLLIRRIT